MNLYITNESFLGSENCLKLETNVQVSHGEGEIAFKSSYSAWYLDRNFAICVI